MILVHNYVFNKISFFVDKKIFLEDYIFPFKFIETMLIVCIYFEYGTISKIVQIVSYLNKDILKMIQIVE